MDKKLIFKVFVLCFSLVVVIFVYRFLSSQTFKKETEALFSAEARPFQWCSSERKQFVWLDQSIKAKFQSESAITLSKKFCKIQIQAVQGVDIATLKWQPLAVGLDSEGQQVVLEWNSVQKIFRAEGLPFRSAQFTKQLVLN